MTEPKKRGRPPGAPNKLTRDIKAMAAEHGPAALAKIVSLMGSKDQRVAMAAAQELLNRGYGRPAQPTEHSGPDGAAIPHSITVHFVKPGKG